MKSKFTLKTLGIISCAVFLSVALAIGVIAVTSPMTTTHKEQATVVQTEHVAIDSSAQPLLNATESYIGEAEATAIALAHAGLNETDVSHMMCKLDYDDGIAEYEVEFWDVTKEYDYEINAINGEIIGYDYDMESYGATPVTPAVTNTPTEYIGEAEAKAIAFAHAGVTESEASRIKCELDFDDGYAEYEVEWEIDRMEYEYTISATDGTIWEHDVEYDN